MGCLIALLIIGGIGCLLFFWPLSLILWALAFIVSKVGKGEK